MTDLREIKDDLQAVVDHFMMVMKGPLIRSVVTFENGVEGIPTIAKANKALLKLENIVKEIEND